MTASSIARPLLLIAAALALVPTGETSVQTTAAPVVIKKTSEKISTGAVDKWVTVTGKAAGTDMKAQGEAIAHALRKAVEQACGTFLTSQSESRDYKAVYDRVLANTVGYVREYKEPKIWVEDGVTYAKLTARVSTQKFRQNWAVIAHTLHREGNPRVIIAIADASWTEPSWASTRPAGPPIIPPTEGTLLASVVQGKLEDFFLSKGLQLVDRGTAVKVNKRDIILAGVRDDVRALAALGARFKADVVIYGQASARYGNMIRIAEHPAYKFVATLNVRAVRTDSAQLIVSKTFGPVTATSLQKGGGREKAMAKLAQESAPKVLAAVVEAWRKQVHVSRNIALNISGMDYENWKKLHEEAKKIRGLKALRLREIVEGVAAIDAEYDFDTQGLADRLTELKRIKLKIVEFNPNRLKLELVR